MITSIVIAFAMYSKIPMPRVEWDEKNMRYVMAAFPLVGLLIGGGEYLLWRLLTTAGFGETFRTAAAVILPVMITGGIHLDGFMDTMDARSSWGDREKKLAILKDSHAGAFAILGCCVYFLALFGVWNELLRQDGRSVLMASSAFFFSRILSGLGVTCFRCAKNSGLAHTFHSAAHRKAVQGILLGELVLCAAGMLVLEWRLAIPEILTGGLVFAYYRCFSYKEFGGINGDMAGYFVCLCELLMALAVAVTVRLAG